VTAGLVLAIAGCHVPGKRPAPGLVAQLHAAGAHVVCYLSAGSWEDWRPDRQRYPAGVIGKAYDGWVREDAGRTRWALNDYADGGQRNERWFGASVRKVHRTIATLINGLAELGSRSSASSSRFRARPGSRATRRWATSDASRCFCS
jgi:hypothetical protein